MQLSISQDNYFFDPVTRTKYEFYDPRNRDIEFIAQLNESITIKVAGSHILSTKMGLGFHYNGELYIIDDKNQESLVHAAYIINNNYDQVLETDNYKGRNSRRLIFRTIMESLDDKDFMIKYGLTDIKITYDSLNITMSFNLGESNGSIEIRTISNMVNSNCRRRDSSLPFLPYKRGIDKFNAYYISIYQQENGTVADATHKEKYKEFIEDLCSLMNSKVSKVLSNINDECLEDGQYNFKVDHLDIEDRVLRCE